MKKTKSVSTCKLDRPELSAKSNVRGCLQQPNTDSGTACKLKQIDATRTLTVKVTPDSDQWKRLRDLSYQAMHYKNCQMRAKWAEAIGLRIDPAKEDKHDLSKFIRKTEKGELSGSVYAAAEREIQAVWQRDGKKIMAGYPWSQWQLNNSLSVRSDGVRLSFENDQYVLSLSVQHKQSAGGCWVHIPLAKGTEKDKYQSSLLGSMTSGHLKIAKATVIFKPNKGKTLCRLTYSLPITVPPMGKRVATVTNIKNRFLLRTELTTFDYTNKLTTFKARKEQWDAIRRRVSFQIGKRKGHARAKRKVFANTNFSDWTKTHIHQWTRDIIDKCIDQGVGKIVLLDLAGGDWPAFLFEELITYKAQDAGIEITKDVDIQQKSTDRAITHEIKKEQRKARKIGDAARTLNAALQ